MDVPCPCERYYAQFVVLFEAHASLWSHPSTWTFSRTKLDQITAVLRSYSSLLYWPVSSGSIMMDENQHSSDFGVIIIKSKFKPPPPHTKQFGVNLGENGVLYYQRLDAMVSLKLTVRLKAQSVLGILFRRRMIFVVWVLVHRFDVGITCGCGE